MEFKLDVYRLLRDELEYELQIRRIDYSGNVEKLRKTLRSALALEKSGNVFSQIIQLDAKTEITICEQKLKELKDILFTTESSTWPIKKIQCKLAHIFGRVDRISSSEESLLSKRSELVNLIMEFISEFSSKVAYTEEHDVQLPNFPEFFNEQSKEVENSDSDNKLPTVSSLVSSKSVPVYKWNLKFSGKLGDGLSFNAFLEKVEDLCISRNVSKRQLFDSAIDLFEGEALLWFRMVHKQVLDWDSLVSLMKQEFTPSHSADILWKQILNRTQGANESIGIYVATMTCLFDRMPISVSNELRLKVLRGNILPFYQERLVLLDINTTTELINYCRKLEETKLKVEEFKPAQEGQLTLEPDLDYHFISAKPFVNRLDD